MLYPFNLRYGQIVVMSLFVNGQVHEVEKLSYCGVLGENWLWFQNVKTLENHLVKEDQFPNHHFKMGRENECILKYAL